MKKLFVVPAILLCSQTFGSHLPGGFITYQCIAGNQYEITLSLVVECPWTLATQYTINFENDCSQNMLPATVIQVGQPQEVTMVCAQDLTLTNCSAGPYPGNNLYTYKDTVNFPASCDSWKMMFTLCCRNSSVNMLTVPGLHLETILNSTTAPCNNSVQVGNQTAPIYCISNSGGITMDFNFYELDGDSLNFSFTQAKTGPLTTDTITYATGYSSTQPVLPSSFVIDPQTGVVTIPQSFALTGDYVVAILCEEFDANGNLKGSVTHDVNFEVINCTGDTACPSMVGLDNVEFIQSVFTLYPNPTSGVVMLDGSGNMDKVQVLDMMGRNVTPPALRATSPTSRGGQAGSLSINLSGLPNGVYYVRIREHTQKVVLQK